MLLFHPFAKLVQQRTAGFDAAIGREQGGFEFLEEGRIDPGPSEQLAEVGVEDFASARQARFEARRPGSR